MKVLKNTLVCQIDHWDDPGDYPNTLADGPLANRKQIIGLAGRLVVQLSNEEAFQLILSSKDFLTNNVAEYIPNEVKVCDWNVPCWTLEGKRLTIYGVELEIEDSSV